MNDIEKEIINLRNKIQYYNHWYYDEDNPKITDQEYDALYDKLLFLEKKYNLENENSPTQKVGGQVNSIFEKHKHKNKLYSLSKCNSFEELSSWVTKIQNEFKEATFTVEYKYDGLTLALTYNNKNLILASTRGNGIFGEVITHNVACIESIPKQINYSKLVELQGEGIMLLSVLKKFNETAKEKLKNARNAVSGAIRNKETIEVKKKAPIIMFYSVNYIEDKKFTTQVEMLNFLKQNNFKIGEFVLAKNFDDIENFINKIDREALDFLIDGVVIKINEVSIREKLGYTEKFPRWAIAYKFAAEEKITKILDVIWNVGRTGKISPVAQLEEVEIAGVSIKNATLNSYNDILRKKIKINADVFIRRSNDVIPEVTKVVDEENSEGISIKKPEKCPVCGLTLVEKGENLFCVNSKCKGILLAKLNHFVSKECMNIEGVSIKLLELIYNKLNIKYPYQLYSLKYEDFVEFEGFKDKKINNILNSIKKSKNIPLSNFINSLSIPNIGLNTARGLADYFKTFDNFMSANEETLSQLENIGDITAFAIKEYFFDKQNIDNINKLFQAGVKPFYEEKLDKLQRKVFVITGKLPKERKLIEKDIINYGGVVSNAISKRVDYLICGENYGSKFDKAKKLNINIITFEQFENMLI